MKKCPYCGKKFSDETAECPYDGELLEPNAAQPPPIPPGAARRKAASAPPPPALNGVAIAAICCAIGLVVFGFLAALAIPNFIRARNVAIRNQCTANMKQIGSAMHTWAAGHGGRLPNSFADLSNELVNPAVLHCPGDAQSSGTHPAAAAIPSYEFLLPGWSQDMVAHQVIIRCPIHGTELHGDGSVHVEISKDSLAR